MDGLGELQVTPKQLLQTAEEWEALMKKAKGVYEAIRITAKQTEKCFRGSVAEVFRKEIEKRTEEGMDKLESMQKFSVRLTRIAEIYDNAEGENKDVFDRG